MMYINTDTKENILIVKEYSGNIWLKENILIVKRIFLEIFDWKLMFVLGLTFAVHIYFLLFKNCWINPRMLTAAKTSLTMDKNIYACSAKNAPNTLEIFLLSVLFLKIFAG